MFSGFDQGLANFLSAYSRQLPEEKNPGLEALVLSQMHEFCEAMDRRLRDFYPPHRVVQPNLDGRRALLQKTDGGSYFHIRMPLLDEPSPEPALHIVLSTGGIGLGAGLAEFGGEHKERFQQAIATPECFNNLVRAVSTAGKAGCHIENLTNKSQSRIVLESSNIEAYAALSGLVVRNRQQGHVSELFNANCTDWFCERLRHLLPLQCWIRENLVK